MLITCPIVILLQEVQIVPHNSSPTGEFAGFNIEVLGGRFNHVFSGFSVFLNLGVCTFLKTFFRFWETLRQLCTVKIIKIAIHL